MASASLSSSWSWRTTRTTTLSLSSSSSSSSSSKQSKTSNGFIKLHKLSIGESRSLLPEKKALSRIKFDEIGTIEAKIRRIRKDLTFKSFFQRRSLWRRIFFASKKVRSIILLNVITIVYASEIPVLKEVEAIMDPAAFTVVRFAVSAIPFLPSVYRARKDTRTLRAGTELGLWVSLAYLLQALGLLSSEAGRSSFISMLTVIVVPLLDGIFGAMVPPLTWFGAVMSVVGVAMLECSGAPPSVGDLFNFISAIFFGVHMLRTERISRTTKKENFVPLLGYEVCVVAFFSLMWYFVGGWFIGARGLDLQPLTWERFWASLVFFPWIPAIYTGVFSTCLCLWAEMAAMRDVTASETAIVYGLEPVWGAGFAWFLLGERWGATGWLGACLVIGGSLTVQIFGSLPSSRSGESEGVNENGKYEITSGGKSLSASPVTVRSEKNKSSILKK